MHPFRASPLPLPLPPPPPPSPPALPPSTNQLPAAPSATQLRPFLAKRLSVMLRANLFFAGPAVRAPTERPPQRLIRPSLSRYIHGQRLVHGPGHDARCLSHHLLRSLRTCATRPVGSRRLPSSSHSDALPAPKPARASLDADWPRSPVQMLMPMLCI